uniref:CYP315A1 n=1 Tax=Eurytemora affinis TaxID=88015 RepID=A0A8B0MCU2_EURAF|nr:CYP315A1 [Eurytemora affinis]
MFRISRLNIPGMVEKNFYSARFISNVPMYDELKKFQHAMMNNCLHVFTREAHKELGPIFKLPIMNLVFIADPSMSSDLLGTSGERYPKTFIPESWEIHAREYGVKRGLIFLAGEEWWEQRSRLNPLMLKSAAITKMNPSIEKEASELLKRLDGDSSQIQKDVYRSVTKILLELFIGTSKDFPLDQAIERVIIDNSGLFRGTTQLMFNPQEHFERKSPEWMMFIGHVDGILATLKQGIRASYKEKLEHGVAAELFKLGTSLEDVEKIVCDFLLGGVDTTTTSIMWVLHELGQNPDVQERIRAELKTVCGDNPCSGDVLESIPLMKGLFRETSRLYPAVPFLSRIISKNVKVGEHILPPGTNVMVSNSAMAFNSTNFPNPSVNKPERWIRDNDMPKDLKNDMAASVRPFGHGVRMCVGRRVAENSLLVLVSNIVQNYQVSAEKAEYATKMIGVPKDKIKISIKPL